MSNGIACHINQRNGLGAVRLEVWSGTTLETALSTAGYLAKKLGFPVVFQHSYFGPNFDFVVHPDDTYKYLKKIIDEFDERKNKDA